MTIRKVFDSFLEAQERRLKPGTYSDYETVIDLFARCLQWYAWDTLPEEESDKYEEYEKAGKEFADIYGHERIAPNTWEFLDYFMTRKVLAGDTLIEKTSPRVIRKLLKWMAEEELIDRNTMEEYLPGGDRRKW